MNISSIKEQEKHRDFLQDSGWIITEHDIHYSSTRNRKSQGDDEYQSPEKVAADTITCKIPSDPATAAAVRKAAAALAGMLRHEQVYLALVR